MLASHSLGRGGGGGFEDFGTSGSVIKGGCDGSGGVMGGPVCGIRVTGGGGGGDAGGGGGVGG